MRKHEPAPASSPPLDDLPGASVPHPARPTDTPGIAENGLTSGALAFPSPVPDDWRLTRCGDAAVRGHYRRRWEARHGSGTRGAVLTLPTWYSASGSAPVRSPGGPPVRSVAWGGLLDGIVVTALGTSVSSRGRQARVELERAGAALLQSVSIRVVDAVLAVLDLTELVRSHVDLDALVAAVDLDAVVRRIDLDAVAATLDLDRLVALVDLDAAVRRVDLDGVVRRVDLDAVIGRVDLDAVAARIDPNPLVTRVDLDAAVARIDIVGIAREVIAAIDLPEIVRDSTGALSSDAVRTVRAEGMQADDVVAGFVDRVLRRRLRPQPVVP